MGNVVYITGNFVGYDEMTSSVTYVSPNNDFAFTYNATMSEFGMAVGAEGSMSMDYAFVDDAEAFQGASFSYAGLDYGEARVVSTITIVASAPEMMGSYSYSMDSWGDGWGDGIDAAMGSMDYGA